MANPSRGEDMPISMNKLLGLVAGVVFLVSASVTCFWLFENVDADEIMVVQAPLSGQLTWYSSPGIKWQGFGKMTSYPKRSIYEFKIPVRFNDGGHATMHGSIQYEMPLDNEHLTALHVRFGSRGAIQKQLVETVTNKSVYMTGPLMSSKESYAEKRNALIYFVEDQVVGGVYRTIQRDTRIKDQMTGVEKTATVVEVLLGLDGKPERQEEAVLTSFGIHPFNFSITEMPYDDVVEKQIKNQQEITMDVQTAIADAKKAEQRAITIEKQGEADAAKSKWEQEVLKARAVVEAQQRKEVAELEAEQRLAVAKLDRDAAEQTKLKEVLLGEGESKRRQLVMDADGALDKKLEAYKDVNRMWAEAASKYGGNWVPQVIMGSGQSNTTAGTGASVFMDLIAMKAAKDLGLELGITSGQKPRQGADITAVSSNTK